MPIQLFPVLVNFIVNARASTNKIVDFLGAVEVDNKRHHLQQVFYFILSISLKKNKEQYKNVCSHYLLKVFC